MDSVFHSKSISALHHLRRITRIGKGVNAAYKKPLSACMSANTKRGYVLFAICYLLFAIHFSLRYPMYHPTLRQQAHQYRPPPGRPWTNHRKQDLFELQKVQSLLLEAALLEALPEPALLEPESADLELSALEAEPLAWE